MGPQGSQATTWPWALFLALFLAWAFVPARAHAHPSAISTFDARTDGRHINFEFVLDATSVIDLINRGQPLGPELDKSWIPAERRAVFRYIDRRFHVANSGRPCTHPNPPGATALTFRVKADKVVVKLRYSCKRDIHTIQLRSSLFLDEETPHQLLGTFHHRRAVERYFFTGGERSATIEVDKLRQRAEVFSSKQGFRMATPPPGAFREAPKTSDLAAVTARAEPATVDLADLADEVEATADTGNSALLGFGTFVRQGVIHIFGGLDHVLFVLCLVVAVTAWKRLALVLTAFTLAHSITLALGSLDLMIVSPRLVEPLIAASIVYVAVENIVREHPRARPKLTFGFGLVHGLGFSSVLHDIGLPAGELVSALLGFNLGVEAGQLMLVLPIFPALLWLRNYPASYRVVRFGFSAAVALVGTWWCIERLLGD